MGMRVPSSPEGRAHVLAGVFVLAGLLWAMVGHTEAQADADRNISNKAKTWEVKLSFEPSRPSGPIRLSFPEVPLDLTLEAEAPLEFQILSPHPPSRVLARVPGQLEAQGWLTQKDQLLEGQLKAAATPKGSSRKSFQHWKERVFHEHNWAEPGGYAPDKTAVHRRALPTSQVETRPGHLEPGGHPH